MYILKHKEVYRFIKGKKPGVRNNHDGVFSVASNEVTCKVDSEKEIRHLPRDSQHADALP